MDGLIIDLFWFGDDVEEGTMQEQLKLGEYSEMAQPKQMIPICL